MSEKPRTDAIIEEMRQALAVAKDGSVDLTTLFDWTGIKVADLTPQEQEGVMKFFESHKVETDKGKDQEYGLTPKEREEVIQKYTNEGLNPMRQRIVDHYFSMLPEGDPLKPTVSLQSKGIEGKQTVQLKMISSAGENKA